MGAMPNASGGRSEQMGCVDGPGQTAKYKVTYLIKRMARIWILWTATGKVPKGSGF